MADIYVALEDAIAAVRRPDKPVPTVDRVLQKSTVNCGSWLAGEEARQNTANPSAKKGTAPPSESPLMQPGSTYQIGKL